MEGYGGVSQVMDFGEETKGLGGGEQEGVLYHLKTRELKIQLKKHEFDREFIKENVKKLMQEGICSEDKCDKPTYYVNRQYTNTLCKLHFNQAADDNNYFSIKDLDVYINKHLDAVESYFIKSEIITTLLKKYISSDQILTEDVETIQTLQDKMATEIVKFIQNYLDEKKPKESIALQILQNFQAKVKKILNEIIRIVGVQVFTADITNILREILSMHHQREVNMEEDTNLYSLSLYQNSLTLIGVPFVQKEKFDLISKEIRDLRDKIEELSNSNGKLSQKWPNTKDSDNQRKFPAHQSENYSFKDLEKKGEVSKASQKESSPPVCPPSQVVNHGNSEHEKIAGSFSTLLADQKYKVPISPLGGGSYMFGTKKIFSKIMNGKLVVRVSGAYMEAKEFVHKYGSREEVRVKKRIEQGLDVFTAQPKDQ